MELNSAVVTPSPSPSPTTTASTPDTDTDTPPTTHLSKALLSLPTSSFRRYHNPSPPPPPSLVVYRECLKNHAATLGGHALDGCGEFMPAPTATPTDPTSLKCAACGCHRNFHRRDPETPPPPPPLLHTHTHLLEYHPNPNPSPYPISPPPISSSYYPSALLALSTGVNTQQNTTSATTPNSNSNGGRKRHRTKFSQEQKEKMYSFSEKLGWKMQKRDQGLVEDFCTQVGVAKGVLKVWMHNNKHTFGKRDLTANAIGIGMDNLSVHPNNNNNTRHVPANSASS